MIRCIVVYQRSSWLHSLHSSRQFITAVTSKSRHTISVIISNDSFTIINEARRKALLGTRGLLSAASTIIEELQEQYQPRIFYKTTHTEQ
jgi:hypothetical protein